MGRVYDFNPINLSTNEIRTKSTSRQNLSNNLFIITFFIVICSYLLFQIFNKLNIKHDS